ncbi:MAG TPA: AAA family ATPase, partial [Verrucomicrobiae bacterium]|nr:AAA family ATPase [Verrucomicrobiae bacterium]
MNELISLDSTRAREARLSKAIGNTGFWLLTGIGSLFVLGAVAAGFTIGLWVALLLIAPAIVCYLPAIWWKRQLSVVPPIGKNLDGRLSVDVLARLKPGTPQQPQTMLMALNGHWQTSFILDHLLLTRDMVLPQLSTETAQLGQALQIAATLADHNNSAAIEPGFIVAGLLMTTPAIGQMLVQFKAQSGDIEAIANWLGRNLEEERLAKKRTFGGIGRDWAFGFTPLLDRFGHNVSLSIARHGAHFGWLTHSDGVLAIEAALASRTSAIALIGPDGIGKTNSVYALAQRLIEGNTNRNLAYHQVITLSATDITSNARGPGDLEHIMISLANEAAHAGHVILFFDDAQLFFADAPGAFDATQILLSIVQSGAVPMIFALAPNDYQRLKTRNQSLAGLLTPVVLQEL